MLILTRRKDEAIRIGEKGIITVRVIEIREDRVRLGIDGPREIPIHRPEIFESIEREGKRQ